MPDEPMRCPWAVREPEMTYHDTEWGVPVYDDTTLFEFLVLEGAQAGLSWNTILRKREGYRKAFACWDIEAVAEFGDADVERLLNDTGIVRNRLKIESAISNARACIALAEQGQTLSAFLWGFVDGTPIINAWKTLGEVPASTPLSDTISKELKKRGFRFVGSTTMYAHMQACGFVNDHLVDCFRYRELTA